MEENIKLTILPVEMVDFNSEYTEKLKTGCFREAIRMNHETCVYRNWETTQLTLESMPMSRFMV